MGIYQRGESWYFDFIVRGQRHCGAIGAVTKAVAREVSEKKKLEALEGKLVNRPLKAPLFGVFDPEEKKFTEAAGKYLAYYQQNHKPASYRRMWNAMTALSAFFGEKRLDTIDPFSIERYKTQRKTASKANATVNRELACLKNLFNMGRRWGWTRENPVRDVKSFRENNARIRWLDLDEDAALLGACESPLKPMMLTVLLNHCEGLLKVFVLAAVAKRCQPRLRSFVMGALDTGFRAGELSVLRWKDVDFARGTLSVASGYTKNGDPRTNPMSKRLMESLRDWQRISGAGATDLVFEGFRYREPFERARKAAGLGEDVVFHSTRHTYISRMIMAGVDLRTVQELAGHKTIGMTMRYAHLAPEHKRRAVGLLDKVLEAQVPRISTTVVMFPVHKVAASGGK